MKYSLSVGIRMRFECAWVNKFPKGFTGDGIRASGSATARGDTEAQWHDKAEDRMEEGVVRECSGKPEHSKEGGRIM